MESAAVSSEDKTCFSFHALYLRLKKGRKAERKRKRFFLTISEILQNQVQIDYDNDNTDCYDCYGDNFDDFGDENYRTPEIYHGFLAKIYSFEALLLGFKKRTKTTGQGSTPSPPKQAMPV